MNLVVYRVVLNFPKNIIGLDLIKEVKTNLTKPEENTLFFMSLTSQKKLFIAYSEYLLIFDVTDPTRPHLLFGKKFFSEFTNGFAVKDSYVFIGNYTNLVYIFNSDDGNSLQLYKIINIDPANDEVLLQDLYLDQERNILYILDNIYGIFAYDVYDVANPRKIPTNFDQEGGLNFKIAGNSMIMSRIANNKSEEVSIEEYEIHYLHDSDRIVKISFIFVRDNGKFPNLISMYLSQQYGVLLFQNIYISFRTGVPQSVVPNFEEISKRVMQLGVKLLIPIDVRGNMTEGYTEYIPSSITIVIADTGYLIFDERPNSLNLICHDTEKLIEGNYKYQVTQIAGMCGSKKKQTDIGNFHGICMINNTLSIQISREITGKKEFIIGLSVGLTLTVIILIICIIYYKRTQKYQRLYNELSQKNENFGSKLEISDANKDKKKTESSSSGGSRV